MPDPRIVVLGATGAVGQIALLVLAERNFPMASLRLVASERSVGKRLFFSGSELEVERFSPEILEESDLVFVSATDQISKDIGNLAASSDCIMIDDSGVWRMDPSVPLVIPEVNAQDILDHQGIISIPNCSTTTMVMALWPLHKVNPIKRIVVSTYQSVSGTGAAAIAELRRQAGSVSRGEDPQPEVYPHQIAFNVLPHIGSFGSDGYTSEEIKMIQETRKIMHAPDIAISATCVRVPVEISHSEAVTIEFTKPFSADDARRVLEAAPGVVVVDVPSSNSYPMPINASGKDETFVGRLREDRAFANGLSMWVVSDNLRKGAATNAVQIAEEIVNREAWLS